MPAVARRAGADALLRRLPEGYATPLSTELTGGVDLSLGQWQRVAPARAFHRGGLYAELYELQAQAYRER
ncbi:hypothetical protein [Kineococcus arenarius]|uniref:hypothetical protein n=1 Tax=unclassified Kineococcus TaxID=2621656 RepID=UPI003D7EF0DF